MLMNRLGPFIIPVLVVIYAVYMIAEQWLGSYRETSQNYATMLGGIAIVCALIVMARIVIRGEDANVDEPAVEIPRSHYIQVITVVVMMSAAVLLISTLGYVITFLALLVGGLYLLGVRSIRTIAVISILMVAVVHFGLVKELQLPLPAGILDGLL